MFVIQYYMGPTLVAIEGPVACARSAQDYLDRRTHYLDFRPRILSMNALRTPALAISSIQTADQTVDQGALLNT